MDRPQRRLPLRELLTDAEKKTRDLVEHVATTMLARTDDLHDLSRPLRKKSHYPTLLALGNALQKVLSTGAETDEMLETLTLELEQIREHARREKHNRG
jgi:hypothetical protein